MIAKLFGHEYRITSNYNYIIFKALSYGDMVKKCANLDIPHPIQQIEILTPDGYKNCKKIELLK